MPEHVPNDLSGSDEWSLRRVNWWLLLLIPLSIGVAVLCSWYDKERFHGLQVLLEYPAPWLMVFVAVMYAARSIYTRNPLYILLCGLAASFAIREFEFFWTDEAIYPLLGVLGVWTLLWRKRLPAPSRDWQHTSWLTVTCLAYIASQTIARRAFRFVPGEHEIHRSLEECAETAAHLAFIVTSLVGNWRRFSKAKDAPSD